MYAKRADIQRLGLMVQRLTDADLLLAEEGSALLEEIEAFEQARDEAAAARVSSRCARLLPLLDALMQTSAPGASTDAQAEEIVRRILHTAGDRA